MLETTPIVFRVDTRMRAALERAAAEDHRNLTSLIRKILATWLEEQGYLPKPEPKL
jgi:uncharacterized protein (DUF1778 family)